MFCTSDTKLVLVRLGFHNLFLFFVGLWIPQRPQKPRGWTDPRDIRDEEFAPPSFYQNAPATTAKRNESPSLLTGEPESIQLREKTESSTVTLNVPGTSFANPGLVKTVSASNTPVAAAESVDSIPLPAMPQPADDSEIEANSLHVQNMLKSFRQQT